MAAIDRPGLRFCADRGIADCRLVSGSIACPKGSSAGCFHVYCAARDGQLVAFCIASCFRISADGIVHRAAFDGQFIGQNVARMGVSAGCIADFRIALYTYCRIVFEYEFIV